MPQFPAVSVPQLYSSLLTAARSIPRDPLRPSLQLSETVETLVQRAFRRTTSPAGQDVTKAVTVQQLSKEEVDKLGFGIGDLTRLDRSLKAVQEINQDTAFRKVSHDLTYQVIRCTGLSLEPRSVSAFSTPCPLGR